MSNKPNDNQNATKADLQKVEQSLKKFAIKTELKKVEKNLRAESLKLEIRLERVEDKVDVVDGKLDNLQNTLDSFLGRIDNLETDNKVGANQTRDLRIQVDDHESRISRFE